MCNVKNMQDLLVRYLVVSVQLSCEVSILFIEYILLEKDILDTIQLLGFVARDNLKYYAVHQHVCALYHLHIY